MTFKLILLLALTGSLSLQAVAQCNDPFTLTTSPGIVCSGRPFTLNATNYPGATYAWTGPAGSGINPAGPSSQTLGPAVVATHGGVYTVTMSLGACTYTSSINLLVQITPTISGVTYTDPMCVGRDNVMTANSGSGIGATYDWTGPDASGPGGWTFSSTTTNVATRTNMQVADAGIHTVTVTSTAGCQSDPFNFVVNVHPVVESIFTPIVKYGCDEDSVQFENNSIGQNSNAWDFGDGNTSSSHSPLHIYKNQGSYVVRLIVGNGVCFDTSYQQININHSIKADFTISDDSICQYTQVDFTNATTYTPAILPTYAWNFKDGAISSVVDPSHLFERVGEYSVKLVATDFIGCKDSIEHIVVVDSAGAISFESSDDALCAGQTIKFTGTYMHVGNTGLTWTMGDGNNVKDQSAFDYSFDRAGRYNVTFDATYRICPNVTFSKEIIVKPFPKIDLGPDTSICVNGKPLLIKDRINEGNPLANWKWNTLVENTSSAMTVRHPGTYGGHC